MLKKRRKRNPLSTAALVRIVFISIATIVLVMAIVAVLIRYFTRL